MKKSKSVNSIITQMARDNFLAFCQLMLSDKPYEVSKIHKVMADVLVDAYEKVCKGEKVRIILSVPPRHGKSVTASVMFPAWALGKNPDLRFILSTYAADLAEVNGRKARDIIASPQYQTVFPNIRLRADLKSKRKWMIQKKVDTNWLDGGDFTGVGVGGSVTGRGADIIIVDDPHKGRIEAESSTDRQRVYEYYKSTLYSRLEGHGAVILIMQRWHEDDLVGRLTDPDNDESKDEWTIVNFPAVAEEDEYHNGELFRKRGEPLWPEKFGLDVLANIRMNQGPYNWSSQYQQEPIDKENALFRESMFSYYDDADLTDQNLQYYTFMDPNSGRKSKDVDEVVVLTLAKTRDNPRIYRIREDAGRYTIPQAVDILFKHIEEYDPVKVVVEHNALQNTFKYVVEEEQRKRGVFFKIYPVKKDNKEQRIMGMVPLYEQGLFKHRHTDKTFEEQLLKFPSGRHDDRIDCQSFCLEFLKKTSMVQKLAQYIPQTFGYYEG